MTIPSPADFGQDASGPAKPAAPINMPAEIGGYRVQRIVGSGGMATVYAAMQKQPRRIVAIKVMKAGVSTARGDSALRRFKREIEILGKLRHPYIAQIYAAGMHDDGSGAVPYFVMEYIPGAKTITEYVAARQLDFRERLKLFIKVCAAVEHGHRHKVIHRDLKPANILIDESGDPKIIDFGVAQAVELDLSSQTMNTEAGRLVGTLQYMSPEQLDTTLRDLDARCDVYALGALLYRILTGRRPHDLTDLPIFAAVRVIREELPKPPSQVNPEVRGDLETIILKAIERDRSRRYSDAGSLGRDVVRFLADKPIHARPAGRLYRAGLFMRRHRTSLISGGIVAAIMSIALAIVLLTRGERTPSPPAISPPPAPTIAAAPAIPPPPEEPAPIPFTLHAHVGLVTAVSFMPDSLQLVSSSNDRTIAFWDAGSQAALNMVSDLPGAMRHFSFSADGATLAAAGDRSTVHLLDCRPDTLKQSSSHIANAASVMQFPSNAAISAIALNPAGDRLAAALDDFTVHLLPVMRSADDLSGLLTLRSGTGILTAVAFSRNGNFIAAGSQSGVVYVWNAHDGSIAAQFRDLSEPIIGIGFTADLNTDGNPDHAISRLVAVANDGTAMTWPLIGDDPYAAASFTAGPNPTIDVCFDSSGHWLACAGEKTIDVWDFAQNLPESAGASIPLEQPPHCIAIDSKCKWIAAGQANGDIVVFPINAPRKPVQGH